MMNNKKFFDFLVEELATLKSIIDKRTADCDAEALACYARIQEAASKPRTFRDDEEYVTFAEHVDNIHKEFARLDFRGPTAFDELRDRFYLDNIVPKREKWAHDPKSSAAPKPPTDARSKEFSSSKAADAVETVKEDDDQYSQRPRQS
jgi:hypothetical protein